MSKFYSLTVEKIKNLTTESVCIRFDVSAFDSSIFNFKSGQYITIEHKIDGLDVRRSYSISSSPNNGIEIGVKLVENGLMSTFLTRELNEGDILKVNGKKINSQTLKLPSGKILKGDERKLFETKKIKLDVLKSEKIVGLN